MEQAVAAIVTVGPVVLYLVAKPFFDRLIGDIYDEAKKRIRRH